MTKKTLGRTGLAVTQLGFGAMELRGPTVWGGREVTDAQADAVLNAVLDSGINFIDTAPDYGLTERRMGRFISSRRSEYILATKCGCDMQEVGDTWETPHVWTRDRLMRNISQSLERMKTDHVDILQLHNPRGPEVDWDMLVTALGDIQKQGLTRFVGVSHVLPELDQCIAMGVFDTFQIPYSCLEPQHYDAISRAAATGAGVIIRGGIAKGGPDSAVPIQKRVDAWSAAKLSEVAGGMTPAELILRHTLTHPGCHTTIVGTLNPDHLKANLDAAARGPLSKDIYEDVRRRVAQLKA